MGRPRTVSASDNDYAPLVTVRLPRSDLAAVKEYASEFNISRGAAIRDMVKEAIAVWQKKRRKS